MKKLKRILAILMTMAMVLGMAVTASAEEPTQPTQPTQSTKPVDGDSKLVEVKGVEDGATYAAYQIIDATYDTNGFTGYVWAPGISETGFKAGDKISGDADLAKITDTLITKLAKNPSALTIKEVPFDPKTTELEVGTWMILVTPPASNPTQIYNPMIVSVYYSTSGSNNAMTAGKIDATMNWTLEVSDAYAKSSKPTIDKKIVSPTGSKTENGTTNNGADVAVGDNVSFEVDTIIPKYSDSFETVTYKISDKLSAGLKNNQDAEVTVEGGVNPEGVDASYKPFTITYTGDQDMEIVFDSDYALVNAGKTVKVNYTAKLQSTAGQNFDMNSNTAKLTYSNDPSDSTKTTTIEDKTYTYTFEIDGNLNGEDGVKNEWVTEELKKVDADTVKKTTVNGEEIITYTKALGGAEFELKNDATGKVYTATSEDTTGRIHFEGLDAGTYTLTETKAPEGYSRNTTPVKVVISATYNQDGTLASYTITIDGNVTSTYTATYTGTTVTNKHVETMTNGSNTYNFLNTKLTSLPSTGGIGTYIFTIAGIIIMAAAAGFFFVSRRKANR